MKVRPYRVGDYEHLTHRPRDTYGEYAGRNTKLMCEQGNTLVVEHDGIPVAIIGIHKLWTGVAHAWTVISDEARGNGIALTKMIATALDEYCAAHKIRRCEAMVKANVEENIRWLKLIGFNYECTHFNASPTGGNLHVYTRFYYG